MQFIVPETLNFSEIIFTIFGVVIAIQGLMSIITGKLYGKEFQKYTEKSIKKAARPIGVMFFLCGVAFALSYFITYGNLGESTSHLITLGVSAVVYILTYVVAYKALLKKKEK